MENYTARNSGSVGCEILADGEVVAWTLDGYWAAVIIDLLERAEEGDPCGRGAALMNDKTRPPSHRYP